MTTGSPFKPVNSVTICCKADNSATMYKNMVISVHALRNRPATAPYRCLVHSVNTKPSGHLRLMIGPSAPKTNRGSDDDSAYTKSPWTPAIVAIWGYVNRIPDPNALECLCQPTSMRRGGHGEGEDSGSTFLTQVLS